MIEKDAIALSADNFMKCPNCGEPYGLHITAVTAYSSPDSHCADRMVKVQTGGHEGGRSRLLVNDVTGKENIPQPNHINRKRELDCVITTWCEMCHKTCETDFLFHKGVVMVDSAQLE